MVIELLLSLHESGGKQGQLLSSGAPDDLRARAAFLMVAGTNDSGNEEEVDGEAAQLREALPLLDEVSSVLLASAGSPLPSKKSVVGVDKLEMKTKPDSSQ